VVSIEFTDDEIDVLWSAVIEQVCKEHMAMQDSRTAKDLFTHKQRKETCDGLIRKIKVYCNK
jgi:hypothetical protein